MDNYLATLPQPFRLRVAGVAWYFVVLGQFWAYTLASDNNIWASICNLTFEP